MCLDVWVSDLSRLLPLSESILALLQNLLISSQSRHNELKVGQPLITQPST